MFKLVSTAPKTERVVLVGLCLKNDRINVVEEHLAELASLAATRGLEVVTSFIQKLDVPNSSTWIGRGKVEEIKDFVCNEEIDSVLFDDELSPGKLKNLSTLLDCRVWDRTMLILEIFAMRAQTVQAKTQVTLAQYRYLLPRLTNMWTHLSRQRGGAGMQGTGEKELETDKRVVKDKIHLLRQKLRLIEKQSKTKRLQRKKCIKVALGGYTNTGKSTLMGILSKSDFFVEDKLFATLDTAVRRVVINDVTFLLADTVGFIRKLPHMLIEAFKSTLAEIAEADLLLHVVDMSNFSFESQIDVVKDTLCEIGAGDIDVVLILNKLDKVTPERLGLKSKTKASVKAACTKLEKKYSARFGCPVIIMSAHEDNDLLRLRKVLYKEVASKCKSYIS